jgi:hypothetical protein
MLYAVITIPRFDRELKRLVKKYSSLKKEYEELIEKLEINPELGISLGNNVYKIRLSIASEGKGKRGGARIITFFRTASGNVYLLTIYDKSEYDTISDDEIRNIINEVLH